LDNATESDHQNHHSIQFFDRAIDESQYIVLQADLGAYELGFVRKDHQSYCI